MGATPSPGGTTARKLSPLSQCRCVKGALTLAEHHLLRCGKCLGAVARTRTPVGRVFRDPRAWDSPEGVGQGQASMRHPHGPPSCSPSGPPPRGRPQVASCCVMATSRLTRQRSRFVVFPRTHSSLSALQPPGEYESLRAPAEAESV